MWARIIHWIETPKDNLKEHSYSWEYMKKQALWHNKDLAIFFALGLFFGFLLGLIVLV